MLVFLLKASTAQDSTTVTGLTEEEVRTFHDIYDGRDECYAQFLRAVNLHQQLLGLYAELGSKNRQLEKIVKRYQLDEVTYEEIIELSVEDLNRLQKAVNKLQKKVNRRNTIIYILSGVALAETIALVAIIAIK